MRISETAKIRHVDIRRMILKKSFRKIPLNDLTKRESNVLYSLINAYAIHLFTEIRKFDYSYNRKACIWLPNANYSTEFEENDVQYRIVRREQLANYALTMLKKTVPKVGTINRYNVISRK